MATSEQGLPAVQTRRTWAGRLRSRIHFSEQQKRFFLRAVLVALGVRIGLLLAGYFIGYIIIGMEGASIRDVIRETHNRWDATNYEWLAEHGYTDEGHERLYIVFFPLYPVLIWAAHWFMWEGSYFAASLFVSAIASVFAGYFIQSLAATDGADDAEAERSIWYMSLFPTAYFMAMPYTEALFLATAIGSFLAARKERWLVSGIAGALCTATRMQGMALVPALAVEALLRYRMRAFVKAFWLVLVPAGLLLYLGINQVVFGDAFAFQDIQKVHWFHHPIWPWEGVKDTISGIEDYGPGATRTQIFEFRLAAVVLTAGLLVGSARWLRPSYQVYGWVTLIFLLSVSFQISMPRYILGIFPLFLILARLGANQGLNQVLLMSSAILMGALFAVYATRFGF